MAASGEYIPSCCESEGRESLGSVTGSDICDDNGQPEYESLERFVLQSEEEDTAEENVQSIAESTQLRKQKRKQGRKSVWPDACVSELVGVICDNEYYRRRLIFTNNKAVKNSEIYSKVLKDVKNRLAAREESFPFTVAQIRVNFKACVSICKKAAMTRRTASGIDNCLANKGYGTWFKKLYPFIESRDSCNPDKGIEPPFEKIIGENDSSRDPETPSVSNGSSSDSSAAKEAMKYQQVPVPRKRARKEMTNNLLKDAVLAFNNFTAKDTTESLLAYFREENERSRQHEKELAHMQMQMWQSMLQLTAGQLQRINNPVFQPQITSMNSTHQIVDDPSQFTSLQNMQRPTASSRGNKNGSQSSSWFSYIDENDNEQF